MKKYIIGFIVGIFVSSGIYFLSIADLGNSTKVPSSTTDLEKSEEMQKLAYAYRYGNNLSVVSTNANYNDEQLEAQFGLAGFPAPDHNFFTVATNDSLLELTRGDIEKICIQVGDNDPAPWYLANIFLTPESRRRVGAALLTRAGKHASIRLFGIEIHNLMVSPQKVQISIDNADTYTDEADFDILVSEHSLLNGFSLLKLVLGSDTLESCDPETPLENFPYYVAHQDLWEQEKQSLKGAVNPANKRVKPTLH